MVPRAERVPEGSEQQRTAARRRREWSVTLTSLSSLSEGLREIRDPFWSLGFPGERDYGLHDLLDEI